MQRHFGQKAALIAAGLCATLTLPALAGFVWVWRERGGADPWVPSMAAILVFLASCAVVLYVMSRPKPPLPEQNASADPEADR
ncbi:MAG: hypothetical protein KDH20_16180 [Rhodocyclaceae bacterium]|nr:hypothetical protein [Rhodocyclaceae bacterium]